MVAKEQRAGCCDQEKEEQVRREVSECRHGLFDSDGWITVCCWTSTLFDMVLRMLFYTTCTSPVFHAQLTASTAESNIGIDEPNAIERDAELPAAKEMSCLRHSLSYPHSGPIIR